MESGNSSDCELKGCSQISTKMEDFAGCSAAFPILSNDLKIEHSDVETENAMLKGNCLWQVVDILIGGAPSVLAVCFGRLRINESVRPNK
jgi:hypothetical protein